MRLHIDSIDPEKRADELKTESISFALKAAAVVAACALFPDFAAEYSSGVAAFSGAFMGGNIKNIIKDSYQILKEKKMLDTPGGEKNEPNGR